MQLHFPLPPALSMMTQVVSGRLGRIQWHVWGRIRESRQLGSRADPFIASFQRGLRRILVTWLGTRKKAVGPRSSS